MTSSDSIERIWAREVLNFRGNPRWKPRFFWPTAVMGKLPCRGHQHGEQRGDSGARRRPRTICGEGALKAAETVRKMIAPALKGMRRPAEGDRREADRPGRNSQ